MTTRGDWIQTYSGGAFYPFDPRPEDVHITDIAHALSQLCRYGGHSRVFYSVAQHSVLVSQHAPAPHKLWALLHDASEAYLVDVPRPIKRALPDYRAAEKRIMAAVCARFGLPAEEPPEVTLVDNRILADERKALLSPMSKVSDHEWGAREPPLGIQISAVPPFVAREMFTDAFVALGGRVAAAADDAEGLFA